MRHDPEHFGDSELELVHLSRRLREAQRVERLLDEAGIDYVLEPAPYKATLLFVIPVERFGVYFHVPPEDALGARRLLAGNGLTIVEIRDDDGGAADDAPD